MKRQLALFDKTHLMLCESERQAREAYEKTKVHHRERQYRKLLWEACFNARLKYEVRNGMVAKAA